MSLLLPTTAVLYSIHQNICHFIKIGIYLTLYKPRIYLLFFIYFLLYMLLFCVEVTYPRPMSTFPGSSEDSLYFNQGQVARDLGDQKCQWKVVDNEHREFVGIQIDTKDPIVPISTGFLKDTWCMIAVWVITSREEREKDSQSVWVRRDDDNNPSGRVVDGWVKNCLIVAPWNKMILVNETRRATITTRKVGVFYVFYFRTTTYTRKRRLNDSTFVKCKVLI